MQLPKTSRGRVLLAACLCAVVLVAVAAFERARAYATGYPDLESATSAKIYTDRYEEYVDDLSGEDFDELMSIVGRLDPRGSRVAVGNLTPTTGDPPPMFSLTLSDDYVVRLVSYGYESRLIVGSGSWKVSSKALADLRGFYYRCYDRYWLPVAHEMGID